ncbi:hypothetical protein [Actinomadura sp. DC4]|uniref:hypothetical protein n=1 Tax=Actinomadura sp. DC4 TaxID=3055069 RepID=UPI0025B263AD|nr:hypothetical protein [Actinomadura sp. DC4]MDN3353263.1 hypothetical protein [Actinomadura sp. DC4]
MRFADDGPSGDLSAQAGQLDDIAVYVTAQHVFQVDHRARADVRRPDARPRARPGVLLAVLGQPA